MNKIFCLVTLVSLASPFSFASEGKILSKGEVCEIFEEMDIGGGEEYTKGDRKAVSKLCSYDLHSDPADDVKNEIKAMAACPKMNSTFPGVNFLKISKKKTREQVEAECNPTLGGKNKGVKAKFKYSISGTKTSSILGYYHISRALGIKMVPPAVLRTMDREHHTQLAERAVVFSGDSAEFIARGWQGLLNFLQEGNPAVVTADGNYSYGALSRNPTDEQKTYNGIWLGGKTKKERLHNFMTRESSTYQKLKDRRPVSDLVGTSFNTENYSAIQRMKDVSDMIILDSLFGQRDRFGNTHSVYHWLTVNPQGAVKKFSIDEIEEMINEDAKLALPRMHGIAQDFEEAEGMAKDWRKQIRPRRTRIQEVVKTYFDLKGYRSAFSENMLLKDNDAGFNKFNPFVDGRVIEWVYHVSPETFEQLMKLYQAVIVDSALDSFLTENIKMSAWDLAQFKEALTYLAEDLKRKDDAGTLLKDLQIKAHFSL